MKNHHLAQACSLFIFFILLFYSNAIQGALLLLSSVETGRDVQKRAAVPYYLPLDHKNAAWLFQAPFMPALVATSNDLRRQSDAHLVGNRFYKFRSHQVDVELRYKPYENVYIPEDAIMLDGSLGKFYWIPQLTVVDRLGLTDATIARNPVERSNSERIVAHDRSPTNEYIAQRGINFQLHSPEPSAKAALQIAAYAVNVGPDVWMPFDASSGHWVEQRFGDRQLQTRMPRVHPLSVHFDGGISLHGFGLSDGPAPAFAGVVRYQVVSGITRQFSQSIRLYNQQKERIFLADQLIRHPFLDTRTQHWTVNQYVDTHFAHEFSPDLAPGTYQLGLVVYDFDTGNVTHEMSNLRTEVDIGTLRISADGTLSLQIDP